MAKKNTRNGNSAANLGFEAKPMAAANTFRNNMDAAEYKHGALGFIFFNPNYSDLNNIFILTNTPFKVWRDDKDRRRPSWGTAANRTHRN